MAEGWIAIETSGEYASAAVSLPHGEVIEEVVTGTRQHARDLLPAIAHLLGQADLGPEAVRGIVVSEGPGSFTGLRIGATVAKALAHVYHRPLRTASALSVIARSTWRDSAVVQSAGCDQRVLAVTDALRGELYAALYLIRSSMLEVLKAPAVVTPEALASWPSADLRATARPVASTLLDLLDVDGGTFPVPSLETWEPEYGRPAEAQAKWEATHGRRLPDSSGTAR